MLHFLAIPSTKRETLRKQLVRTNVLLCHDEWNNVKLS